MPGEKYRKIELTIFTLADFAPHLRGPELSSVANLRLLRVNFAGAI